MMRFVRQFAIWIPIGLAVGCTSRVISGMSDGGTSSGTPASAAATSSGGVTSSATGTAGTSTGTSSAGATSSGGETSSGGRTTGGGTSSGGGSTGQAVQCGAIEALCNVNSECCSDTCSDAGSCACSIDHCSTDGDCCDGAICYTSPPSPLYPAVNYCCHALGQPCDPSSGSYCCGGTQCKDGICSCLPLGLFGNKCETNSDCCTGQCLAVLYGGLFNGDNLTSGCFETPGESCDAGSDCGIGTCQNGTCSGCNSVAGYCATDADCCGGSSCSTNYNLPLDAGGVCCVPTGGACFDDGGLCCSGNCTDAGCQCAQPSESCGNGLGCCSGICAPVFVDRVAVCCQLDGQTCYSPPECCSGNCGPDQKCACVPTGHACGERGSVAPLGAAACCSGECSDAGACL